MKSSARVTEASALGMPALEVSDLEDAAPGLPAPEDGAPEGSVCGDSSLEWSTSQGSGARTLGSILALPLVWAIRAYQWLVSPMLAQQCRFYPSCSAYAVTALQRYGPLKGSWLALRRLGRCHPWNPGGVDHVPAREHGPGARSASP